MTEVTRREFVKTTMKTTLAAGFALAVQPVTAQTIHTDAEGLTAGTDPNSHGRRTYSRLPGHAVYRARRFPSIWSCRRYSASMSISRTSAAGFAKQGYLAIAPELYARQGDVSKMADIARSCPLSPKSPMNRYLTDLDAAVIWAENSGHGDTGKLGITGFCWGGRIVWLYAAHNPASESGRRLVRASGRPA